MKSLTSFSNDAFLVTAALISCATALSSTSTSSTTKHSSVPTSSTISTIKSSTPSSTYLASGTASAAAISNTTTPYFIELLGFNNSGIEDPYGSVETPWGFESKNAAFGAENAAPYFGGIYISDIDDVLPKSSEPNYTKCNEHTYEIQHTTSNPKNSPTLLAYNQSLLILGWPLQAANDSSDCTSFEEVETVPFALNVGQAGTYNGSLVLGGWYDTNRIASTAWHLVPESVGNRQFVAGGVLSGVSVLINEKSYKASLNFWTDQPITLFPGGEFPGACSNESLVISFPGANGSAALDVQVPLTFRNNELCDDTDYGSDVLEDLQLGFDFFQAVYMYVDKAGQLYLTAANQLNATSINMAPFDADATLTLPAGVTEYTAPPAATASTGTKKSMATPRFTPGFAGWNAVWFGLLVAGMLN